MLVFILESAAVGQADGHHLGMGDCFGEERSVELDEGDVIVASVQQFRLVSLVNHNFFDAPGISYYGLRKASTIVHSLPPQLPFLQSFIVVKVNSTKHQSLLDSGLTCGGWDRHSSFPFVGCWNQCTGQYGTSCTEMKKWTNFLEWIPLEQVAVLPWHR